MTFAKKAIANRHLPKPPASPSLWKKSSEFRIGFVGAYLVFCTVFTSIMFISKFVKHFHHERVTITIVPNFTDPRFRPPTYWDGWDRFPMQNPSPYMYGHSTWFIPEKQL